MKKKFLFIGLIVFVGVLFYEKYNSNFGHSISEQEVLKKTTGNELNNKKPIHVSDDSIFKSESDERMMNEYYTLTEEKSELNKKILDTYTSKTFEVSNISRQPRNDSKEIKTLIAGYFDNYEENFRQVEELFLKCLGAKERISSIEERLNGQSKIIEAELNGYYFDKGLLESGVCKKFGTQEDPFWTMLKLARRGNEEMRVSLLENMIMAIYRGAINIQKYPDKYLELRNEAEEYLQKYSHKGVIYATEILANQYSGKLGKNQLLPTNPVLAYYYAYLADVQNTAAYGYWERDLLKMYDSLTERQQSIVDRMTKNL